MQILPHPNMCRCDPSWYEFDTVVLLGANYFSIFDKQIFDFKKYEQFIRFLQMRYDKTYYSDAEQSENDLKAHLKIYGHQRPGMSQC